MFLFVIPVLLLASSVRSIQHGMLRPRLSAASDAQIRFAKESKYDDTGPGARGPQHAYNTYKTLEDALVGYIDDPDTKLPELEQAKALQKLLRLNHKDKVNYNFVTPEQNKPVQRLLLTDTEDGLNPGNNLPSVPNVQKQRIGFALNVGKLRGHPARLHRFQPVKGSPVNLAHFARDPVIDTKEFDPNPNYSYSYGVHDKMTGDSKSAHETRDGDKVTGFYTFMDADGMQRTVHYTADDKQGFRAIVRRTVSNRQ